jgi:hypothetical protein
MESMDFPEKGAEVRRIADGLKGQIIVCDPAKGLLTVRWHRGIMLEVHSCTLDEFVRDWELTGEKSPVLKEFFITFAVVLAFILVCSFFLAKGCDGRYNYPSNVLDHKTAVVDGNTEFDVILKLREFNGSAPGSVVDASSEIIEIVKHELEEHRTEQKIVFHIVEDTGGGYDVYGRVQPTHLTDAFDISYSMEDLKLINWDTVLGNGRWLLDLGSVSHITGTGDDAIRKYCEDDGFKKYAQIFCANY